MSFSIFPFLLSYIFITICIIIVIFILFPLSFLFYFTLYFILEFFLVLPMMSAKPESSEELSAWLNERKKSWKNLRMAKRREKNLLLMGLDFIFLFRYFVISLFRYFIILLILYFKFSHNFMN